MTDLLTAAQMRAIEQAAIASGDVTGLELMERAGRGVVEAIFEEWPDLAKTSHRAVVLCGPGNNGGDGFVVARLLKDWGWEVEVFLYGDPDKLPPDARVNYERWRELGEVQKLPENVPVAALEELTSGDVIVDALFGTGLGRPLAGLGHIQIELNDCVANHMGNRNWPYVVSVDISSGYCSDSGRHLGEDEINAFAFAISSDLTVSFHSAKTGHYLSLCSEVSRSLKVKSIGLEGSARPPGETVKLIRSETINVAKFGAHKYTHGHALILSGGPGKTGAARLAARGALRIGAGLVTIGCPNAALHEVAAQTTAVMCRPLDGAPGLSEALEDDRLNALCLGPGLGLGPDTQQLVLAALKSNRPTVLDADALTRFQNAPETLFAALHENCVVTPHAGEFKRLFPDIAAKLDAPATTGAAYSKVDATRAAARRAGCTILFKGPDTVIADQTGRAAINASVFDRAAPWLATAGSGDVLAGFITGLLARGFAPMAAAETGAWLHTECALSFGPGLIAEDLPEALPKVLRTLIG